MRTVDRLEEQALRLNNILACLLLRVGPTRREADGQEKCCGFVIPRSIAALARSLSFSKFKGLRRGERRP